MFAFAGKFVQDIIPGSPSLRLSITVPPVRDRAFTAWRSPSSRFMWKHHGNIYILQTESYLNFSIQLICAPFVIYLADRIPISRKQTRFLLFVACGLLSDNNQWRIVHGWFNSGTINWFRKLQRWYPDLRFNVWGCARSQGGADKGCSK